MTTGLLCCLKHMQPTIRGFKQPQLDPASSLKLTGIVCSCIVCRKATGRHQTAAPIRRGHNNLAARQCPKLFHNRIQYQFLHCSGGLRGETIKFVAIKSLKQDHTWIYSDGIFQLIIELFLNVARCSTRYIGIVS